MCTAARASAEAIAPQLRVAQGGGARMRAASPRGRAGPQVHLRKAASGGTPGAMAGAATGVGETDAIGAAWGQAVAAASSAFGGDASDSDAASLPRITDALTAEEALKVPTTGQGLFRRIFTEVLAEDGLLVVARGMGLRLLLERFIRVFCGGRSLVAVLGCSHDSDTIRASLSEAGVSEDHLPVAITNEMSAAARVSAYQRGGPVIVTSRILVIDLLTRRLPAEAVAGMLVAGAHRLTEASSEAFCLRLFRDANPSGFVKGFSDDPGRLASGFNRLESSLKLLGVRQLHLWPRFHALAQAGLTAPRRSPEVVDLSVPLTPCVLALQRCLVTALDGCLRDLQSSPAAELDGIDLGRAAQEGFEVKLRRRLDPVWHRLSAQARQVVADVGVIRRLLAEVARLDAVALYALLLSLRQAHRHQATDSLWIMSDAAEELYRLAKDRVFVVERAAQRQSDEAELSVAEPDDVALLGTAGEWERRVFGVQGWGPAAATEARPPAASAASVSSSAHGASSRGSAPRPSADPSTAAPVPRLRLRFTLEACPKLRLLRRILREANGAWLHASATPAAGGRPAGRAGARAVPRRATVLVVVRDHALACAARDAVSLGVTSTMTAHLSRLLVRNAEATASLRLLWRAWRQHRAAELGLAPPAGAAVRRLLQRVKQDAPRRHGGAAALSADVGTSVAADEAEHFAAAPLGSKTPSDAAGRGERAARGGSSDAAAAVSAAIGAGAAVGGFGGSAGPAPHGSGPASGRATSALTARRVIVTPEQRLLWLAAARTMAERGGGCGTADTPSAATGDPDSLDEEASEAVADLMPLPSERSRQVRTGSSGAAASCRGDGGGQSSASAPHGSASLRQSHVSLDARVQSLTEAALGRARVVQRLPKRARSSGLEPDQQGRAKRPAGAGAGDVDAPARQEHDRGDDDGSDDDGDDAGADAAGADGAAEGGRTPSAAEAAPGTRGVPRSGLRDAAAGPSSAEAERLPAVRVGRLDVHFVALSGAPSRRALLQQLRPQFVVLLEPSASFVREVEVYSALAEPPFPGAPRLRVYSTRFANSVEQSHFTASLADEEDAFRKLIQEKSNMAVPRRASAAVERAAEARTASTRGLDAWGISTEDTRFSRTFGTLSAGGASASKLGRASAGALGGVKDAGRRRVVVDIREFRSALPSLLHAAGMEVVPVTIDVGDYVIAPRVCLERKSVPDLVASLASGRLYTQCVAMTRHYDLAVLLVEFDGDRPFGFGSAAPAGGNDDGRLVYDIQTKLCILAIHFPSLRILWARSPHAAVDMILAIKVCVAQRPRCGCVCCLLPGANFQLPELPRLRLGCSRQPRLWNLPALLRCALAPRSASAASQRDRAPAPPQPLRLRRRNEHKHPPILDCPPIPVRLPPQQLHPEPDPRLALAAGTEDFERVKAELQAEAAAEASGGTTALATRSAQSSAALGAAATAGAVATSAQDAARDVLRRIPGVTEGNVGTIMRTVYSVAELSSLSLGQLGAFLDHRTAAKIFDFLHGKVPPGGI